MPFLFRRQHLPAAVVLCKDLLRILRYREESENIMGFRKKEIGGKQMDPGIQRGIIGTERMLRMPEVPQQEPLQEPGCKATLMKPEIPRRAVFVIP